MKVFDGPGMVADKAEAPIFPVRIDGAQYTPFSRRAATCGCAPSRRSVLPYCRRTSSRFRIRLAAGSAPSRGRRLADLMSDMMFATSSFDRTLFEALLDARHIHGRKHVIARMSNGSR